MHQVISQMQIGQAVHKMMTLNQSLLRLVGEGSITASRALERAYDPEELTSMLQKKAAALQTTQPGLRKRR
jgi:Tfp pilus assembly pilus retraction ATPase PilT